MVHYFDVHIVMVKKILSYAESDIFVIKLFISNQNYIRFYKLIAVILYDVKRLIQK
jgi:hypothetical protein